jgi:2-oxoglutarate ferredoxin oxidoreductase subunit beta
VALGRRNADVLVVIHNNWVYGLTKGQAAPTMGRGVKVKSLAFPNINDPVNPILVGMSAGYTFLARSYAYNADHLKNMFKAGIRHNGAGILEIIQPCVTWNNIMNMDWVSKNTEILKDWDPVAKSEEELLKKEQDLLRLEAGEKRPLGVLLEHSLKETMEERIASMSPYYKESPPAKQGIEAGGLSLPIDIEKTFGRYLI